MVGLDLLKHQLHLASRTSLSPDFPLPLWQLFPRQHGCLFPCPWSPVPEHFNAAGLGPFHLLYPHHFLSLLSQSHGFKYQLYADDWVTDLIFYFGLMLANAFPPFPYECLTILSEVTVQDWAPDSPAQTCSSHSHFTSTNGNSILRKTQASNFWLILDCFFFFTRTYPRTNPIGTIHKIYLESYRFFPPLPPWPNYHHFSSRLRARTS